MCHATRDETRIIVESGHERKKEKPRVGNVGVGRWVTRFLPTILLLTSKIKFVKINIFSSKKNENN